MKQPQGRIGQSHVAIISIIDEELEAVRRSCEFEELIDGTSYFYRTRLADNHYDAILARPRARSNLPCQELAMHLIEQFRPEFILLCGIGGGVEKRDDVQLGDVVVADHVEYYEIQKLTAGKARKRALALDHPSSYLHSPIILRVMYAKKWLERITVDRPEDGSPKAIIGNLIAGEKILGDDSNKYQQEILTEYDNALVVDMESWGLARASYTARATRHYNVHYTVIRGISDLVGDKGNNETRQKWKQYAAATSAAFTAEILDQLLAICVDKP